MAQSLSFTDVVNQALVAIFNLENICLNDIRENFIRQIKLSRIIPTLYAIFSMFLSPFALHETGALQTMWGYR